jgi:hypothetical protein
MRGVLACVVVVAACGYPKLPRLGDDDSGSDAAGEGVDAPAGFAPIHLDPTMLLKDAPDLVVSFAGGLGTINTTNLTINGANNAFFVRQGPYAVIYANAFSIQGATQVVGANPLIVVATDKITISSALQANGAGATGGPGSIITGVGVGSPGASFATMPRESSGGGGGSYGSLGSPGGTGDPTKIPAGASGIRYGMNPTDPLVGGSAGGAGGFASGINAPGGGGGAIQLSSAVAVEIDATINAGGGGGGTGGTGLAGGSGGGSGGEIFVEAPMITMSAAGTLVANGGGGGGGGGDGSQTGTAGTDGNPGPGVAMGGIGGIPEGSPGGAGAAGPSGAFIDAKAGDGSNSKGGGGGGGAGRIWVRFPASTPPVLNVGRVSPPAQTDPTLP